MSAPTVTIVVPVKDRRQRMLRCMDALLAQDYPSYDILIVDNESTDGTAEACRERARSAAIPVRVEVLAGTVGAIRNEAARLAESDLIAYTDSDCMPTAGWLAAAVAPFADPGVGIVQGTTLPDPAVPMRGWAATIEVRSYTERFESCNLLVRRDAFVAADGFDEVVGHFWEDTAAGWSMLRRGWRGAFAEDAVVHHDVTHPGYRWWLKRALRYGNIAAVVRAYPELRRELLWGRYFSRSRDAKLVAAMAGLMLSRIDRRGVLLAMPYVWFNRPRTVHPHDLTVGLCQSVLFDVAVLTGMVLGSIRHRELVL